MGDEDGYIASFFESGSRGTGNLDVCDSAMIE